MINTSKSERHPPRVLFFGMQSDFSTPALTHLLESGIEICAVVMPASPIPGVNQPAIQRREPPQARHKALPLLNASLHPSITQIAWKQHIPVWEVHRLSHTEAISTLASYQPDVICVACFSQILPRAIIELPRLACLNVHPALLPANRGPVPLFWTFREGHSTTGVTIHLMNEKMDSGAILAQEAIEVVDGMRYELLEEQCAEHGGVLLARTVWDLYEGRATPTSQDETKSSYHSFPSDEDFVVHANAWSARHVYNFIRGIGHWDRPIELQVDSAQFLIRDATSYSHNGEELDENKAYHWIGNELVVRCRVGSVRVMPLDPPQPRLFA